MNTSLTKYELTAKAKATPGVILPANKAGDPEMRFRPATMTDAQAAALLKRKDGRGSEYVTRTVLADSGSGNKPPRTKDKS